jgi:hypothetical protein
MIRRAAFLTVAVFAVLAQLAAGLVGPAGSICVCSTCISIERQGDGCSSAASSEATDVGGLVVIGERGCTDCHLIPLPDTTYTPTTSAPAHPIPADLPSSRTVLSLLVWPPSDATRLPSAHRQRTPPDQYLRVLRTVVMTC